MASRSKQYYDSHPEARAKKKKYDTKYHATKARRGYRSALNKKRRELGIYGKGGKDVSHTADGGYVLEEPSKNRARQGANSKSTKKAGLGAKFRNRKRGKVKAKSGLAKWFAEDWVDIGSKKEGGGHKKCGRSGKDKDGRPYPKCVPAAKAAKMTASQKKSAVTRKRAAGNPGGKPTNVKTFAQDGLKIDSSTNKKGTKKTVYSKRKYTKKPTYTTYIDTKGNERRVRSGYEVIEEKPKKSLIVKEKTNRRGVKKVIVRGAGQLGRTVYKQKVNSVTGKTEYKKSEAGIDFSGGFFQPSGGFDIGAVRKPQETTLTKVYDAVTRPAQIAMDMGSTAFTMWAGEATSPSSTKASPINLVGTVLKAIKGSSTGYSEEKITSKEVDRLKARAEREEIETLSRIELSNINSKNKADIKLAENEAEKKLIADKNTMQTGNIKNVSYEDQLAVVTKYPSDFPGGRQGVIMKNKTTEEMNDDELKDTLALRTINHMNGDENALTEDEKTAYTTKENKKKGYLTPDGKVAHINLLPKAQRDRWQAKIQAEIEKRKTSDLQTMSQEEYLNQDYLKDTDYKKVDRDTKDFKNWKASYGIPESKWTVGQIVYGNKVVVDIRREKVTEEIKTGVTGRGTRTQGRYTYVFMDLEDVVEQTQDEAFAEAKKNGLPFFYFNGKKIKVEVDPDYVDEGQGQRKQQTVTKMSDDLKSVLKYGGKLNKKLNYGK